MKALPLYVIFLLLTCYGQAQDTLIKRSGDTLAIKLTEVNPRDIHYLLFSYQQGPVFTLPKEEIKTLIYANGYRESYENYTLNVKPMSGDGDLSLQMRGKYFYYKGFRIMESDMLGIAAKPNDKKVNQMIRRVDEARLFQNACGVGAIILFVSGAYIYRTNQAPRGRRGRPVNTTTNTQAQKNGALLMLGGLVSGIFSVSFMIERRHNDRLVVNAYNELVRH